MLCVLLEVHYKAMVGDDDNDIDDNFDDDDD